MMIADIIIVFALMITAIFMLMVLVAGIVAVVQTFKDKKTTSNMIGQYNDLRRELYLTNVKLRSEIQEVRDIVKNGKSVK